MPHSLTRSINAAVRTSTVLCLVALAGCAAQTARRGSTEAETISDEQFGAVEDSAADSASARTVPVVAGADTEVWAVTTEWDELTTSAATAAGVAWRSYSGLDWEAKYRAWILSFRQISVPGQTLVKTFEIPTPYGQRRFEAPALECAETAIFLRATFASWYHLPFFMSGTLRGQTVFVGHFGVIDSRGRRVEGFPNFRADYADYESSWAVGSAWPTDSALREIHFHDGADINTFLANRSDPTPGIGSYVDEMFLNKRVGYLMVHLLNAFSSIALADRVNMFHIKPEAIAPGDVLLERLDRVSVGHTLVVLGASNPASGLTATLAAASMPRQPAYVYNPILSIEYLASEYMGGPGYASYGGGIRRWRTAKIVNERWSNEVRDADAAVRVLESDSRAIAARPQRFHDLYARFPALEIYAAYRDNIQVQREKLRTSPASCVARSARELSVNVIVSLASYLNKTPAQLQAENRTLEDYVFAELDYEHAKTCCWDTTTPQMYEIIMDYATKEQSSANGRRVCVEPTVFRARGRGDGYSVFRAHAVALGREAEWRDYSDDEGCDFSPGDDELAETDTPAPAFCSLPH